MKTLVTLTILTLLTLGCAHKQGEDSDASGKETEKNKKISVTETPANRDSFFRHVADFPKIKDTTTFIADLRQIFKLEVHESPYQKANEKISAYKKVKLFGSEFDYYFIEYDYGAGAGAAFPWKYQLLLTTDGKLVKTLAGLRFEFIELFKNENPFLLSVYATSKGNGGHELFKISADTLENVFERPVDYFIRTYDAHQDNSINEPNELTLKVKDFNKDGFNDISFNGKIVLIQGRSKNGDWYDGETVNGKEVMYSIDNPFKRISVQFVFLYDKRSGHFKPKENYAEKYGLSG